MVLKLQSVHLKITLCSRIFMLQASFLTTNIEGQRVTHDVLIYYELFLVMSNQNSDIII